MLSPKSYFLCFSDVLYVLLICGNCNGLYTSKSVKNEEPTVNTNSGTVVGKYIKVLGNDVASFQGIPFAKPPIGNRRFAKPEPIDPWEDVLVAKDKPPACMQYSSRDMEWIPHELKKSEDCLYLNIWAPGNYSSSKKLPVLVWIYGGGFFAGASSMNMYDGGALATLGNVIVASMNYRVGSFGFLNGGTAEAPGNIGLYDQVLALKWINKNIQYFGGDPKSITIFGESAGAISIGILYLSPLTKGLFQKAIMESGSGLQDLIIEDYDSSRNRANSFADFVGCSADSSAEVLDCLKQKSGLELAKAEDHFTSVFPTYFEPYFGEVCKGCNEFLYKSSYEILKSGEFEQRPILIGNVRDEVTALFLTYVYRDIFSLYEEPDLNLVEGKSVMKDIYSKIPKVSLLKTLNYYFENVTDNSEDIARAISNSLSDYIFNCPCYFTAEYVKDSYYFWFTHRSKKSKLAKWIGVAHVSEVEYIFGKPFLEAEDYTDEDRKFSTNMISKWSSFARNGHPLNGEKQKWTTVRNSESLAYELNSEREGLIEYPRKAACEFWRPVTLSKNH